MRLSGSWVQYRLKFHLAIAFCYDRNMSSEIVWLNDAMFRYSHGIASLSLRLPSDVKGSCSGKAGDDWTSLQKHEAELNAPHLHYNTDIKTQIFIILRAPGREQRTGLQLDDDDEILIILAVPAN